MGSGSPRARARVCARWVMAAESGGRAAFVGGVEEACFKPHLDKVPTPASRPCAARARTATTKGAEVTVGSGSLAGSYTDTVRIPAGSTVRLNGLSELAKGLIVEGTLTHDATSSPSQTINLRVGGTLTVTKSGRIDATKKSTKPTGSTNWPYASHGGQARSSSTQGEYGSVTNPVSLLRWVSRSPSPSPSSCAPSSICPAPVFLQWLRSQR